MSTSKVSAQRVAIVRAAADIAPKVVAAIVGGLSATTLIALASTVGITLSPGLAALLVTIVVGVAGYVKSDTPLIHDLQAKADEVKGQPADPVINIVAGRAEDALDAIAARAKASAAIPASAEVIGVAPTGGGPAGAPWTSGDTGEHMNPDDNVDGYYCPVDPMDLLQCEACQ